MREMATSKTPWISEYPADWKQVPLHALFGEHKNKNKEGVEQNLLSLSYGNIIRKDINTNEGLLPESFNGYNIIDNGDIVLRLTDLQNDHRSLRTGLVTEHGIITSAYVTLRKKVPLSSEYYHYLLHAFDIMKVFYSMGEGIRQSLGYNELSYMMLPKPPLSEQHAIVRYLDSKCAAIDEAIERQRKIIEKLEELFSALVSASVCHGISAQRELKETKNLYLGRIPASWETPRIKDVAVFLNGDRGSNYPSGNDIVTSGIAMITADNTHDLVLNFDGRTQKYVTKDKYSSLGGAKVQRDDIIYCLRGAGAGSCAINKELDDGCLASSLVDIRVTDCQVLPDFLNYYLNSSVAIRQTKDIMNGSCADNVSAENVKNIRFVKPPTDTQKEIVKFVDERRNQYFEAKRLHQNVIIKLEEYRKSIIYNAVTGKIDCRTEV